MISLFRFLFYLISVMVRRLDHLWHVGDFYYLWGGYICSGILFVFFVIYLEYYCVAGHYANILARFSMDAYRSICCRNRCVRDLRKR